MEQPEIVLYDFKGEKSLPESFKNRLRERGNLKVVESEGDYTGELGPEDLEEADVLISRVFDNFDEELFEDTDLKYVIMMATDSSHYPLETLENNGIRIENASEYARESVAELTINMMLHLSLETYRTTSFVESGNWDVGPFPGKELQGKTLGVIGLGSIGSRVAEIADCIGMEIIYNSRSKKDFAESKGWNFTNIDSLVADSDVVSLHCSLNSETRNLLDSKTLEKVNEETIILNGARSELQDIQKTLDLCKEDRIKVWFDALEDEDMRNKLLQTGNAVLTSHSGCATREAKKRLKEITLENLDKLLKGD